MRLWHLCLTQTRWASLMNQLMIIYSTWTQHHTVLHLLRTNRALALDIVIAEFGVAQGELIGVL